jgi:uncharacterized protein (TIGR03435 family)
LNENEDDAWPHIAPLLDDALAGLSAADRHAVVLRYFDGKSLGEVGAALGASEDAAKKRVTRAVEKLRGWFTKRGVTLTATVLTAAISANSVQAAPLGLAATVTATAVKGAVVSGSTLTLIKGALKVMAWTKMKTVIVIGVGAVLAAGTLVVVKESSGAFSWKADSRWLEVQPPILLILPTKYAGYESGIDAGDRAIWKNASIGRLLSIAYGFPESRLALPDGISKEHYDLLLTLPNHPKEALKAEIKNRFGLVGHPHILITNILVLKVSNSNAPGLIPVHDSNIAKPSSKPPAGWRPTGWRGGWVQYPKTTLYNFALDVEFQLKETVRDRTGLTNQFQIELHWIAENVETEKDAYRKAVLDQLGLELVPSREPLEMLVVEKVK